jgi:8-oxo-dGTP diphosphatase
MEFNKELRPKVGTAVYILNNHNQVLLMKRQGSHGAGTWCPPGGHLEFGESFLDCAKRETKEESDLDIIDAALWGVTNDIFKEEGKHYITLALKASGYSGQAKIMEKEKCTEIGWFDLNNLPKPLFLPVQNFFDSNTSCLCGSSKKHKDCHGKL